MTDDLYFPENTFGYQVKTTNERIIEIQPGMNITSIGAIGAGGCGDGGVNGGTGGGGGGGAYAGRSSTLPALTIGTKLAFYAGMAGSTDIDPGTPQITPQQSTVCLAANETTFLNITGTTTQNGSVDYYAIAQTFVTSTTALVVKSISANIYTDTSLPFYAEIRLTNPTGTIIASSSVVKGDNISSDGSFATEFNFGAVYLLPSTTYAVVFKYEGFSLNPILFGAMSTNNTYASGTRWNADIDFVYTQVSTEDLQMTISSYPLSNLIAYAVPGSNASGSTGGAGGSAASCIGETTFSGGNGANAQGGGGVRGGSGGGAAASAAGAGNPGTAGSGATGGAGGTGIILDGNPSYSTAGGSGADDQGFANPGVIGGGGGGAHNNSNFEGNRGGEGVIILVYNQTKNRSDRKMFSMFSPI